MELVLFGSSIDWKTSRALRIGGSLVPIAASNVEIRHKQSIWFSQPQRRFQYEFRNTPCFSATKQNFKQLKLQTYRCVNVVDLTPILLWPCVIDIWSSIKALLLTLISLFLYPFIFLLFWLFLSPFSYYKLLIYHSIHILSHKKVITLSLSRVFLFFL